MTQRMKDFCHHHLHDVVGKKQKYLGLAVLLSAASVLHICAVNDKDWKMIKDKDTWW